MSKYFKVTDKTIAVVLLKIGDVVFPAHTAGDVSFRYTERSNGADTMLIQFTTTQWYLFDQFLSGVDGLGRMLSVRFGYENTSGTSPATVLSTWRHMRVAKYDIQYTGSAARIEMIAENLLALLNDDQKVRVFSDMSASDVVRAIADEYKLTPKDETDIEDSSDVTVSTWLQTHLTDMQFLRHYVIPRTESSKNTAQYEGRVQGRTDYVFYCRDGLEIVFRPPNYDLAERSVWHYPALNAQDTVLGVHVSWFEPVVRAVGGDTFSAIGYDMIGKVPLLTSVANEESTPEKVRLAQYADAQTDVVRRAYPSSRQSLSTLSVHTRQHWSTYAQKNYMLSTVVIGDPLIRVLDTIYLDLRTIDTEGREQAHFLRGRYLLSEVEHTIVNTLYRSSTKMFRRHAVLGEEEGVGRKKSEQQTVDTGGAKSLGIVKKSKG